MPRQGERAEDTYPQCPWCSRRPGCAAARAKAAGRERVPGCAVHAENSRDAPGGSRVGSLYSPLFQIPDCRDAHLCPVRQFKLGQARCRAPGTDLCPEAA